MLDWQTRHILITEREFGKRRTATALAPAGNTGPTRTTLLWMAIRPGSTKSSGAVFACQSLPTAATQPTPATSRLSRARLQSAWARATNCAASSAACKGHGRVAGLWPGHGIPVFQCAPAISALATASPGAITAIARGSHAPGTAPHEFQLIRPDFTERQSVGENCSPTASGSAAIRPTTGPPNRTTPCGDVAIAGQAINRSLTQARSRAATCCAA